MSNPGDYMRPLTLVFLSFFAMCNQQSNDRELYIPVTEKMREIKDILLQIKDRLLNSPYAYTLHSICEQLARESVVSFHALKKALKIAYTYLEDQMHSFCTFQEARLYRTKLEDMYLYIKFEAPFLEHKNGRIISLPSQVNNS